MRVGDRCRVVKVSGFWWVLLVEKVASGLWESIDDRGIDGRLWYDDCKYLAVAALDALGLREELRGAYGYVSARRFVTPWEEA